MTDSAEANMSAQSPIREKDAPMNLRSPSLETTNLIYRSGSAADGQFHLLEIEIPSRIIGGVEMGEKAEHLSMIAGRVQLVVNGLCRLPEKVLGGAGKEITCEKAVGGRHSHLIEDLIQEATRDLPSPQCRLCVQQFDKATIVDWSSIRIAHQHGGRHRLIATATHASEDIGHRVAQKVDELIHPRRRIDPAVQLLN